MSAWLSKYSAAVASVYMWRVVRRKTKSSVELNVLLVDQGDLCSIASIVFNVLFYFFSKGIRLCL